MTTGSPNQAAARVRIMIVEDEPDIATIVAQMLSATYEVVKADNGLEALERLNWYQPDLTVMDLMMPVLDGFDTTRAIKKDNDYSTMPVMFLTARKDNQAVREALMAGGDVYMEKPFDPPELLVRLQEMITRNGIVPKPKRYTLDQIKEHFEGGGDKTRDSPPPIAKSPLSLTAQLARIAAEPRARLLLIHDSEPALRAIKQALKNKHEVIIAQDAEAALDKIAAYQPDILILQATTATFNGFHLAQLLRVNRQLRVPRLIFLMDSAASETQEAEANRLDGILLQGEPLDISVLANQVEVITKDPGFQRLRKRLDYKEILRREEPGDDDF